MKIYHLARYKIAINKCLSIPLISTFHEQHWNVKLNSVCSDLALQIRLSWGSWALCCHRQLPKCVLEERDTRFPSRTVPGKRQGCHSSATAMAKTWKCCGEEANEDNHTGCAKESTWGSLDILQSHSLQGKRHQPSSFHDLTSGNLFHMKQKIVEPLCASLQ